MGQNKLTVEDAVVVDNKIWFIVSEYKTLVSMDIETHEQKAYTIPSPGSYTLKRAFGSMCAVGRKIYLIPFYERVIMQFDIATKEFCRIEIDKDIIEEKSALFMAVGGYQNYLFVMGVFVPAILRIDTTNNHIDYIVDWIEKAEKLIFDLDDAYFRKQSVILKDKLYIPFCNANAVLEIACVNMETQIYCLGEKKQGYAGICFDGDSFWLSPRRNGDMVKWELRNECICTVLKSESHSVSNNLSYTGIVCHEKKKILFPSYEMERYINCENVVELRGSWTFMHDSEKYVICFERQLGMLVLYSREDNWCKKIEIAEVNLDVEQMMEESNSYIVENKHINIRHLISYIQK